MDWQDWIPTGKLRVLCKHLIVDCAVLFVFKITTTLAAWLFPKYEYVIVRIEIFGLILLIAVLLVMLIKEMFKGGSDGKALGLIFAA